MRISDWSSDVCSSDLAEALQAVEQGLGVFARGGVIDVGASAQFHRAREAGRRDGIVGEAFGESRPGRGEGLVEGAAAGILGQQHGAAAEVGGEVGGRRSEEHTSELQSLMRISYAVFCLKKKRMLQTNAK